MESGAISGIQPALLRWARETANMSVQDAAEKLKKPAAIIESWENGETTPSYPQLEKLAYELYKRPLAIFFLPKPPVEPRNQAEFRSLPDSDISNLHRDTVFLIRKARAFQFALNELYGGKSPVERPIWNEFHISSNRSVKAQAIQLREKLGVNLADQIQWLDDDDALKQWRKAIEAQGIFVFKNSFKQNDISGFCLNSENFPVVMINNSTTKTRQIFSLVHEFAHIMANRNGISTFNPLRIEDLPAEDRNIERFCNSIAAELLVPSGDFTTQMSAWKNQPENATNEDFAALAKRYHVSREVVLRKLLDEGRVTKSFYESKAKEWNNQKSGQKAGGNYYATQNAYLSERFVGEVFNRYMRRQIDRDEAADLMGIKPKNFAAFEDFVLQGFAA